MHIDYFSFLLGVGLLAMLMAAVATGFKAAGIKAARLDREAPDGLEVFVRTIIKEKLNSVVDCLGTSDLTLQKLASIAEESLVSSREILAQIKDADENGVGLNVRATQMQEIVKAIESSGNTPMPFVDIDALGQLITPIKESLFRIAADTELGKKKFDVLAKILGVDERVDYKRYIDENPEDEDKAVFQEAVQSLMKRQGLSYQQATSEMKAQMAHRSRG